VPGRSVFGGVFEGEPVVVEEVWPGQELTPCDAREARQVEHAVAARRLEFAAGRHCARRALLRMGIEGYSLLNGPDRAPIWPAGIVGSITHAGRAPDGSSRYCAAVVARSAGVRALGLDVEDDAPLDADLVPLVTTTGERQRLERLESIEGPARNVLAKLIFSAKECFYKAQYPLTRRFLEFDDVEIDLDTGRRRFLAIVRGAASVGHALARCEGTYAVADARVMTGIVVPSIAP
jgi:4'-phosphopantetheinyl transferase EntD